MGAQLKRAARLGVSHAVFVGPDELARHVGMDAATVQRLLLHLEMAGCVERDSLGRYTTI